MYKSIEELYSDLERRARNLSIRNLMTCALSAFLMTVGHVAIANARPDKASMNIARTGKLICEDQTHCNPSAGMIILIPQPGKYARCSFSLIAIDIVVTSAHCLPEDLRYTDADCRDRMFFYFATLKSKPEYEQRADCKHVLTMKGASERSSSIPDLAYIKISSVINRPFFNLSRGGFEDDQIYTLDKIDGLVGRPFNEAIQRQISCTTKSNTLLLLSHNSPKSKVVLLVDCGKEIIPGNSGSGIRDKSGALLGAVHASLIPSFIQAQFNNWQLKPSSLPVSPSDFALASNVACLFIPPELNLGPAVNDCYQDQVGNRSETTTANNIAALDEAISITYAARKWFAWNMEDENGLVKWSLKCVHADLFRADAGNNSERTASVGALTFRLRTVVDRYSRLSKIEVVPQKETQAVVDVKEIGTQSGFFYVKLNRQPTKMMWSCKR